MDDIKVSCTVQDKSRKNKFEICFLNQNDKSKGSCKNKYQVKYVSVIN